MVTFKKSTILKTSTDYFLSHTFCIENIDKEKCVSVGSLGRIVMFTLTRNTIKKETFQRCLNVSVDKILKCLGPSSSHESIGQLWWKPIWPGWGSGVSNQFKVCIRAVRLLLVKCYNKKWFMSPYNWVIYLLTQP